MIFPLPVTRKRFLAPEWVLFFGMVAGSPRLGRTISCGGCSHSCGGKSGVRKIFFVLVGALRGLIGLRLLALLARFGLLLVRRDDHCYFTTIEFGCALHRAKIRDFFSQALQQTHTHFRAGLLTAAEHDHDLDRATTV